MIEIFYCRADGAGHVWCLICDSKILSGTVYSELLKWQKEYKEMIKINKLSFTLELKGNNRWIIQFPQLTEGVNWILEKCDMITHVNLVEIEVEECPFCKMKLLTKEEYQNTLGVWCICI